MLGAVNLEVPPGPAANGEDSQHKDQRPGPVLFRGLLGLWLRGRFGLWLWGHARTLAHIDGADRAIGVDCTHHAFLLTGAGGQLNASGLHSSQQIGLVHNAEKVGFVLFAVLVGGLVVIDDDIESVAAAGLDGNKLLVGVLVIEQIAGHKVALLRKARAGFDGGRGFGLRCGLGFHHGLSLIVHDLVATPGVGRNGKTA